jgi:hypothetical protein
MSDFKKVNVFFDREPEESASKRDSDTSAEAVAAGRAIYAAFMSAWFLMLVIGSPDWNYWRSLGATGTAVVLLRGVFGSRDTSAQND